MATIKEKSEEVFQIEEYDSLETELQKRKMRLCYEHGANYVLDEVGCILLDKELDCEGKCNELMALIKELKNK